MTTTKSAATEAIANAMTKADQIKKLAYQGQAAAEGKQAAIQNYGWLISGQISQSEYIQMSEHAAAGMNSNEAGRVDFAIAYMETTIKLNAIL